MSQKNEKNWKKKSYFTIIKEPQKLNVLVFLVNQSGKLKKFIPVLAWQKLRHTQTLLEEEKLSCKAV